MSASCYCNCFVVSFQMTNSGSVYSEVKVLVMVCWEIVLLLLTATTWAGAGKHVSCCVTVLNWMGHLSLFYYITAGSVK